MSQNAGKRLFEIIGQLPEEMILEAERDELQETLQSENGSCGPRETAQHDTGQERLKGTLQPEAAVSETGRKTAKAEKRQRRNRLRAVRTRISAEYLKYLPVAICLCMVFTGAYYILNNYFRGDTADRFSMSGSAGGQELAEDITAENGSAIQQGNGESSEEMRDSAMPRQPEFRPPVRYDAYDGPVIAMTATGDTQGLKSSRNIKCEITTEKDSNTDLPLLRVTDHYRIRNTSKQDRTVQLVYPFAATLNLAYDPAGEILKIHGQKNAVIKYDIGDSIYAYKNRDAAGDSDRQPEWNSSMEDYQRLFDQEGEYQKIALEKDADWEQEVSVYTFSDIRIQGESAQRNNPPVIGVTVYGAEADVLTCGFAYSSDTADGITKHSFFVSENQSGLMLVVTGRQDREPALGYYSNLDCEEEIEGIQCTMQKQKMSFSDALQLCTAAIAKQMHQDYEQNVYAGELPEYFDMSAAYRALTMIGGEEEFYDTLLRRYQSTELKEVCEKLFGETRIIYAMTTVTIPSKKELQVSALIQKRQSSAYFTLPEEGGREEKDRYAFDFLSGEKSLLNIQKSRLRLIMSKDWQIADSDIKLKRAKTVWKADIKEKSCYFTVAPCFESDTLVN